MEYVREFILRVSLSVKTRWCPLISSFNELNSINIRGFKMKNEYLSMYDLIQLNSSIDYFLSNGELKLNTTNNHVIHKCKHYDNGNRIVKLIHYDQKTKELYILFMIGIGNFNYMYTVRGFVELYTPIVNFIDIIESYHDNFTLEVKKTRRNSFKYRSISSKCFMNQLDKLCS